MQPVPAVEQVAPPGEAVTVYPVTTEPPLFVGANHVTAALPSPAEALTLVGASGTVFGVASIEFDAGEFPVPLTDRTAIEYWVPLFNPEIVNIPVAPPEFVQAPSLSEYSTRVTFEAHVVFNVALTLTWPFPAAAEFNVGALGTALGVALTFMA